MVSGPCISKRGAFFYSFFTLFCIFEYIFSFYLCLLVSHWPYCGDLGANIVCVFHLNHFWKTWGFTVPPGSICAYVYKRVRISTWHTVSVKLEPFSITAIIRKREGAYYDRNHWPMSTHTYILIPNLGLFLLVESIIYLFIVAINSFITSFILMDAINDWPLCVLNKPQLKLFVLIQHS